MSQAKPSDCDPFSPSTASTWISGVVPKGMTPINRCDLKTLDMPSWMDLYFGKVETCGIVNGDNGTTNTTAVSCREERLLAAQRGTRYSVTYPLMVNRIPTVAARRISTLLVSNGDDGGASKLQLA
ncbi:hypothetical protein EYF80_018263 [Liparis tanakae]|uniref:Uncharacterized protein n=1 Tax=Liparis tanakae TaxID=230148 RepID=A0A4Z2I0U6_9TELE|nr:hypothetical protein EYF80_018263 [Liparis tanakae]